MNSMKLKSIKKYDGGTKDVKTSSTPSFASKIKPLSDEQKAKGDSINALDKKKKLFKGGGKDITSKSGGSKPVVKQTSEVSKGTAGTKGSFEVREETMQKGADGKVRLVPGFRDPSNVDRPGQTGPRQSIINYANKNPHLYEDKQAITYKAANGTMQHAATMHKTPATPPTPPIAKTVEKMRLTTPNTNASSSKNSSGKQVMGTSEVAKNKAEHLAKGEYFQNGQYLKTKNSDLKSKEEISKRPLNKDKGIVDDPSSQTKLVKGKFKEGVKKMKLMKKGC